MNKIIRTYKKYRNNENARKIASNFISLSSLQVVSYLFPLITMPYLARVIGVSGFGAIAFAAAVIAYFSTITDWGFKYTAVREISINRENQDAISTIFSTVIASKIILMILSAVTLWLLIKFIPFFSNYSIILWATFTMIPGYLLFPDWLFQAMEEMKYITIMNICSKTIFTILVFCVIKTDKDYIIEPLLQAAGYIISGGVGFYYAIKHFKLKIIVPSLKDCVVMMRRSFNMFISQFFPTLYNNLSIIILEAVSGVKATGVFSAGFKFINITDSISQALSRAFYPFLARRMDKHSFYVKLSGSISIFMSLLLFLSADIIIHVFYTSDFSQAVNIIRILACSPFFLFLMNSFGTNGLVLIGKDNILRNIVIICSIFGLLISLGLIYILGSYGVAIAIVTTWGIRGISSYIMYRRCSKINFNSIQS